MISSSSSSASASMLYSSFHFEIPPHREVDDDGDDGLETVTPARGVVEAKPMALGRDDSEVAARLHMSPFLIMLLLGLLQYFRLCVNRRPENSRKVGR